MFILVLTFSKLEILFSLERLSECLILVGEKFAENLKDETNIR